jgi:hypothetical protein
MYTDDLQRFRKAAEQGDAEEAWKLAELLATEHKTPLGLGDARALLIALARAEDPRFEKTAERWLERLAPEHTEVEMTIARTAVEGLRGPDLQSHRCERVLLALFSYPEVPL